MSPAEQVLAAMTDLAKSLDVGDRWDQAPELYSVRQPGLDGEPVSLRGFSLPSQVWVGPPPEMLARLAHGFEAAPGPVRELIGKITPCSLQGVVFQCETWTVIGETDQHSPRARLIDAMASRRLLHRHKDRIETRTLLAVDRYGGRYLVDTHRGRGLQAGMHESGALGVYNLTGGIFESLQQIVTAFRRDHSDQCTTCLAEPRSEQPSE